MIGKTGRFSIYFKIPFINRYIGKDNDLNSWCIMYKDYDWNWGNYRWKVRRRFT